MKAASSTSRHIGAKRDNSSLCTIGCKLSFRLFFVVFTSFHSRHILAGMHRLRNRIYCKTSVPYVSSVVARYYLRIPDQKPNLHAVFAEVPWKSVHIIKELQLPFCPQTRLSTQQLRKCPLIVPSHKAAISRCPCPEGSKRGEKERSYHRATVKYDDLSFSNL